MDLPVAEMATCVQVGADTEESWNGQKEKSRCRTEPLLSSHASDRCPCPLELLLPLTRAVPAARQSRRQFLSFPLWP